MARRRSKEKPIDWLPIDSRIIPRIFSFGHVSGAAKLFLQIEILLSIGVVMGTLVIVVLWLFR